MKEHKNLLTELEKNLKTKVVYGYLVRKLKFLLRTQIVTVNKKVELAMEKVKFRKYHKLVKKLHKDLQDNVESIEEYLTQAEVSTFLNDYYTKPYNIEQRAYEKAKETFTKDMTRLVKVWGEKRGEVYDAQNKVQEFVDKNDRTSAEALKSDENLEEKLQGELNILREMDFVKRYAKRRTVGLEKDNEKPYTFGQSRFLSLRDFEDLVDMSKVCKRKTGEACNDL